MDERTPLGRYPPNAASVALFPDSLGTQAGIRSKRW